MNLVTCAGPAPSVLYEWNKIRIRRPASSRLTVSPLLEAVSKPQIRFKGKAQTDEKAEHIQYM
jgi:hypothetical protein